MRGLSMCNEVLAATAAGPDLARQGAWAAALGCQALEIAPFTLADDPSSCTEAEAAGWQRTLAAEGLVVSSLHWLLVQPQGLSLTTPDDALRTRTLRVLQRLVGLAAACGAQVLVHGSPAQRRPAPGQPLADAQARFADAMATVARHAQAAGVVYCIEPLAPFETPVVNTLAEAAALVDAVGSPALKTMLDLSAASLSEADAPADLVRRHLPRGHIAHVQLNDRNRRGPGQGDTPVRPVLQALQDGGYAGWLALEPFDYQPDAAACAAASAAYVRGLLQGMQGMRG